MKLHNNQLDLLRHLARFNLLDYESCLDMLDTAGTGDRVALSYAFRPLTKNGYLTKRKDGTVAITKKGRSIVPDVMPLISAGGGTAGIERVIRVSKVAMLMEKNRVPCVGGLWEPNKVYFIPSACWRRIATGVLSTTRFAGMLMIGKRKLAVYDIGDGHVEWQVRAEGSLFYWYYGKFETKADGMLFICKDECRTQVAKDIIRQTMWNRKKLLAETSETDKPVKWSRSPIELRAQYEHVYLTTPEGLDKDLDRIIEERQQISMNSET